MPMPTRARFRIPAVLISLALAAPGLRAAEPPKARPIAVSYTSANAVYLDAGRSEGLSVGARGRVLRGGADIAEVEVSYVAEHSSSCRVVNQKAEVRPGD